MVFLLVVWASIGHKLASRSRYLGEGSVACGMGLAAGTILLIFQHFTSLDKEALRQLLTFNPADFFTCAISCAHVWTFWCLWIDVPPRILRCTLL